MSQVPIYGETAAVSTALARMNAFRSAGKYRTARPNRTKRGPRPRCRHARSVATDKTIADKTETFRPGDTFYVAVKTVGSAPTATLVAHWSYEDGQRISEATQTIAPSGPAVTEFHLSRPNGPGDGWPAGDYKVEIVLNGVSAGTEKFKVQ